MPQDRESGAAAAQWGRTTGSLLGRALGGIALSRQANEFSIGTRRVAIKTAKRATNSVGVTYLVLDRVDDVYGCWEAESGQFDVWALPAALFKANMRETRSRGPSAGRVGIVTHAVFEQRGNRIGVIRL